MYYTIGLLYSSEKNGIYNHIPFSSKVTTDENEAKELFDYYMKAYTGNWRGNNLIYDREMKLDYNCTIRSALVECKEPAYMNGFYLIEIHAYNHNPHE